MLTLALWIIVNSVRSTQVRKEQVAGRKEIEGLRAFPEKSEIVPPSLSGSTR